MTAEAKLSRKMLMDAYKRCGPSPKMPDPLTSSPEVMKAFMTFKTAYDGYVQATTDQIFKEWWKVKR